ncbi:MAG: dolichyl-phosphate beta-glucosyltransferase [Candidatus Binatia bacterium]
MPTDPAIRLSVVIPAFNETQRLPRTLTDVLGYLGRQPYGAEVVVVDDGSTDETARLVREWPAAKTPLRLAAHPDGRNHGKGATVRRGMGEAVGQYRLFMDADNSTTLDHVERFWPFTEQGFDVVIGSRDIGGAEVVVHQSWYKELGGKVGNLIIRALVLPGIADTQAGFKMFSARCVEAILPRLSIERWGFDIELLVAARCQGFTVQEVPVVWRNDANSKVPALAYVEVLGDVWRVRRRRNAGLYF